MFLGCRSQGSILWRKTLDGERHPDFLGAIQHIWHSNRNGQHQARSPRITGNARCRTSHSLVVVSQAPPVSPARANSTTSTPLIELLPAPDGRTFRPPNAVRSKSARRFLDAEALKELEKDLHIDSITSFVPVGSPVVEDKQLTPDSEDVLNEQNRQPRSFKHGRTIQWGKNKEDKRFINRLLQDKSYLSYDWRVPLKLLKRYYRADKDVTPTKRDLIRERACGAIRSGDFLADTVPEPEHWSQGTFYRYVHDLAHFQPPPSPVSRALGLRRQRRGPHTIPEIGETLYDLFHRTELKQCLTLETCEVAMWFFTKHYMLSKARALFIRMEDLQMAIPTSTINILMRAAAHEKDLHTYCWLLNLMIKRGFSPNAETCVIFVQCIERIAVKRLLIREMAKLSILNRPAIRKSMIITTVKEDVISFVSGKGEPRDFLYRMRLKHGPEWLSRRTGNIILNEVSKYVSLEAGLQLLEPLKRHGFSPDHVTLSTFLDQSLQIGSLPLAAQVLETFDTNWNLQPGRYAHERLFLYAWRRGYLNVIRVIWISACLQGFVTYPMQAKVFYSLRLSASKYWPAYHSPRRPTRQPSKSANVFRSLMGKFIIGLEPLEHHALGAAQLAIAENLRTALKARPKEALSKNLREAHTMDREWRTHTGKDLGRKLQHRYPVLLVTDRIDTERGY